MFSCFSASPSRFLPHSANPPTSEYVDCDVRSYRNVPSAYRFARRAKRSSVHPEASPSILVISLMRCDETSIPLIPTSSRTYDDSNVSVVSMNAVGAMAWPMARASIVSAASPNDALRSSRRPMRLATVSTIIDPP